MDAVEPLDLASTPTLFQTPRHERIVSHLLWLANGSPPTDERIRWRFYRMKDGILRRFGVRGGDDWQRIKRDCWTCHGTGIWRSWDMVRAETCERCWGTGVYAFVFVRLERWSIGGRVFHLPAERHNRMNDRGEFPVTIDGLIVHETRGRRCWWAMLALAAIFDQRLVASAIYQRIRSRYYRLFGWIEFVAAFMKQAHRSHCPYCLTPTLPERYSHGWGQRYCSDRCRELHDMECPF